MIIRILPRKTLLSFGLAEMVCPDLVTRLLRQAHRRLNSPISVSLSPGQDGAEGGNKEDNRLHLEFIIPIELLDAVDQWEVAFGAKPEPLASRYEVVARPHERVYAEDEELRERWKKWWNTLHTCAETPSQLPFIWGDFDTAEAFEQFGRQAALCAGPFPYAATTPDLPNTQAIARLIRAGAPIIVWSRRPQYPALLREEIKAQSRAEALDTLPHRLAQYRQQAYREEAHPGRSLVLVWDDPNHLPPDVDGQFQPLE